MKKILLFILVFVVNVVHAQQNVKLANRYFEKTYYSEAIPLYEDAAAEKQSADVVRNLADSYYFTNDFPSAQRWYGVLKMKFPQELKDEYFFRYIHTLKAVGKYDEAYQELRSNATEEAIKNLEAQTSKFKRLSASEPRFITRHLPFNTEHSEFGAVEFNDSIIFSGVAKKKSTSKMYKWNNEQYLRLLTVAVDRISEVDSAATNFAPEINTNMHEANAVFTKDGRYMYFTRNNFKDGKRGKDKDNTSHLQIYRAERIAGKWTNVIAMPFNSENYSTEHPALSADEKKLYFASDMPGSLGSFDIYAVAINEGAYDIPTNLGHLINTPHKEQFPFVSADNKLYFSSDGHMGFGALDVFVAEMNNDEFKAPVNLGLPINSGYDDFAFTINTATKKGYFTSNRATGKGGDDIYELTEKFPLNTQETVANEDALTDVPDKQSRIDAIMAKEPDVITDINGRLIIKTDPIYFDYDLWYIRKESKPILDRVIELMNLYPKIIIEIGSHTDARGTAEYNEELSSKRAASTRAYFLESGIPDTRISSKGYGESIPIIKCVPEASCSEEQHELNRRSEFVITGI